MKITKIEQQKHDSKRFNIYIDNQFSIDVPLDVLIKLGLSKDQELTNEQWEELKKIELKNKIKEKAFEYLSFRPRSVAEMRDKLLSKGYPEDYVNQVIEELKNEKYLDDYDFALSWVEFRNQIRPSGRHVLKMELLKKGIDKAVIEDVLEKMIDKEEEIRLAKQAVSSRIKVYQSLSNYEFKQKITAFLARRGFSWEIIKEVIKELKTK